MHRYCRKIGGLPRELPPGRLTITPCTNGSNIRLPSKCRQRCALPVSDQGHPPSAIVGPVSAATNTIFDAAVQGRLVICGGAGLSRALPADLPSGADLGRRLDERLATTIRGYSSPSEPSNLIAVADAAAALVGGESALRSEVLKLADFLGAAPNYGHSAIAELLCEGAIDCILLWNWDDCIERVPVYPERLQAVHSLEDIENLEQPSIAKIHGCATRRSTLLVTTSHLDKPPLWTDETFASRIRGKTIVFVGVGDVADYARRRLGELRGEFPELDVWIVSPGIVSSWDDSQWAELLPNLPEERKIAMTADQFLDELVRRWIRSLTDAVSSATSGGVARPHVTTQLGRVIDALGELGGPSLIRWFRSASVGSRVGSSTLSWPESLQLLLGLAVLADEGAVDTIEARSQAAVMLGTRRVEALVANGIRGAGSIRSVARRRAEELAGQGTIGSDACFVVAGVVIGNLNPPSDHDVDVASAPPPADDIFDSSATVRVTFVSATEAASRAA